jgi:hypothetical protein
MRTTAAVTMPARGVRQPAFELIAVEEKDPVAPKAPIMGPRMLVAPIAVNSLEGLIVYSLILPNDLAIEMCSMSSTMIADGRFPAMTPSISPFRGGRAGLWTPSPVSQTTKPSIPIYWYREVAYLPE